MNLLIAPDIRTLFSPVSREGNLCPERLSGQYYDTVCNILPHMVIEK